MLVPNQTSVVPRLLAIGLDGGESDFIRSWREALPTLARLLDQGAFQKTGAPRALSGAVWPTFYSGRHPGEHGVYQHLVWDPQRMGLRRISSDWLDCRPFWKTLEEQGRRVIVLDVPYSFPGHLTRGIEITDWGTHGQTHPLASNNRDALAALRKLGKSPIGRETPIAKSERKLASLLPQLRSAALRKGDAIRTLMKGFEWDTFITVFGETHRAGHMYYCDEDAAPEATETPLLAVYRAVDEAVGSILDAAPEDTDVLIFSVHGMMRNYAQENLATEVIARVNAKFAEEVWKDAPAVPGQGGVVGKLRRFVPPRLQHSVGEWAPDAVRQWVVEREIVGGLDWSRTPGFMLRSDIRTEIRLNLAGRERKGILQAGSNEHRYYVSLLTDAFRDLVDRDSGKDLVDEVVDIHAQFAGARTTALPDFAVEWRAAPPARHVHSPRLGDFSLRQNGARGGDHSDFGFALYLPSDEAPRPDLRQIRSTEDFATFIRAVTMGETEPSLPDEEPASRGLEPATT